MIPWLQQGGFGRRRGVVAAATALTGDAAVVSRTSNQTIAVDTDVALSFDNETFGGVSWDAGGYWAASPNPTRLTVVNNGWYFICATLEGGAEGVAVNHRLSLRVGGTTTVARGDHIVSSAVQGMRSVHALVYLTAGQYVEAVFRRQIGSGSTTINALADTIRMEAAKVGLGPIGARVSRSTTQNFSTATPAAVSFDTEERDDGGCWAVSPNPTRLTVPVGEAGWYLITAHFRWVDSNTNGRRAYVRLNGSTTIARDSQRATASNLQFSETLCALYYLAAGDYLELIGDQNRGSTITNTAGDVHLAMLKVAA